MSTPFEAPMRDAREAWRVSREIRLDFILASLTVLLAFGGWMLRQESRMSVVESQIIVLHEQDALQMTQSKEAIGYVRQDINVIGSKIDRVLERVQK